MKAEWDRNWCQSVDIFWPNLLQSVDILLTFCLLGYYQLNQLNRYWDLIISAYQLLIKIHDPSRATRKLGARHYRVSW